MYVRQDHKYYPIFELKTQAEHLMLIKMVLISRIIMLLDKTGKADRLRKLDHCAIGAIDNNTGNAIRHEYLALLADKSINSRRASLVTGHVLSGTEILQVGMHLASNHQRLILDSRLHSRALLD
jgi:hypothetical protein